MRKSISKRIRFAKKDDYRFVRWRAAFLCILKMQCFTLNFNSIGLLIDAEFYTE